MTLQSTAGILTFAALAWIISENRRKVSIKVVCIGIVMQLAVGFVLLKLPLFRNFFLFFKSPCFGIGRINNCGNIHGFVNPGSLGIMIGGMGTMAPERRDEIVALGFRSIIAGTLATCMTGAVVGIIGVLF